MNGEETLDDALDPRVIDTIIPELYSEPYESASAKLKDLYENSTWSDREMAAQKLAQAASSLHKIHGVEPKVSLEGLELGPLIQKIVDPTQGEDRRLASIEEFRQRAKESLYNLDSADALLEGGSATEEFIDTYATQLRREIVAKDVSRIKDMLARGAEAAINPIAGTIDFAFDTEWKKSLQQKFLDSENPNYDESFLSSLAGFGGSVLGFAATSVSPYTAIPYLGAMTLDQGKSVYDAALKETGSHEAAKEALLKSAPWIGVGTFADRLVGGSLAHVFTEGKGFLSTLTGATAGAVGAGSQVAGTGVALAEATGEEAHIPTPKVLASEVAAGVLVGGLVGAASDIATKGAVTLAEKRLLKAREQAKKTLAPDADKETEPAVERNLMAEQFVIKPGEEDVPPPEEGGPSEADIKAAENLGFEYGETVPKPGEQVFEVYHGTGRAFAELSKEALGSSTGAKSAKLAFWGAGKPETAETYVPTKAVELSTETLPPKQKLFYDKLSSNWSFYTQDISIRSYWEGSNLSKDPEVATILKTQPSEKYLDPLGLPGIINRSENLKEQLKYLDPESREYKNKLQVLKNDLNLIEAIKQTKAVKEYYKEQPYPRELEIKESERRKDVARWVKELKKVPKDSDEAALLRGFISTTRTSMRHQRQQAYRPDIFNPAREHKKWTFWNKKSDAFRKRWGTPNFQQIYKFHVRAKNPYIVDVGGLDYQELRSSKFGSLSSIVSRAKEEGHDLVIIKNLRDPLLDDYYAWFEPKQARMPWARNAPEKRESGDLLAAEKGEQRLEPKAEEAKPKSIKEPEDVEYDKLLPVSSADDTPSPLIIEETRKLGVKPELRNLTTQWGFYETPTVSEQLAGKPPRMVIQRQIFRDADRAEKVIAHEFGHAVDAYGRTQEAQSVLRLPPDRKESVPIKLLRFRREFLPNFDKPEFLAQVVQLSKDWRPGWTTASSAKFQAYRARPTELFADLTSAALQNSRWVQEKYPEIWNAWRSGIEKYPELGDFVSRAEKLQSDPAAALEWLMKNREADRLKEALISQKATEERLASAALEAKKLPKKAVNDFIIRFVNRFAPAKNVMTALAKKGFNVEEIAGLYNSLYSWPAAYKDLRVLMDIPLNKNYKNYLDLNIPNLFDLTDPYATWKTYEYLNRIVNETNPLIESIKEDPARYKKAVRVLRDKYNLGDRPFPVSGLEEQNLTGMELVRGLAKLLHEYDTPKERARVREQLLRQAAREDNPAAIDAAELLEEDAFNVRSLLANPDATYTTAKKNLETMRKQLGNDNWKKLEDHSKQYHSIIGPLIYKGLEESGIADQKMLQRLKLNQDNYITFNVLKYFEQDPKLSAALRKQIGTIDKVGDELAATEMKTKAILLRTEFQKAMNSAIEIARRGGYAVTEVPVEYDYRYRQGKSAPFTKSIFEQRSKLQKEDPKNSYMVEYEDGKPTLYKIDSPDFAQMFSPGKLQTMPAMALALKVSEGFNRLFMARELKTIFSLPFIARSRFYDRSVEAIFARSKTPTFMGVHLDKAVRDIRDRAKEYSREYHEGNIAPDVQEMIDNHALSYFAAEDFGGYDNPNNPYENIIYELMGVHIPGEETFSFPARANKKLVGIAEKIPFFKKIKQTAMIDETATKIAGYLIGKEVKGLGPQEAAIYAREYFGTPDPLGGGTEAVNINKLFLFGRAAINGMRSVVNQFKQDPRGFGMQYVYRKGLPRMLMSSAIMGPIIGALFGEEEEKIYRAFLDKISSFDKISKFNIPFGFVDDRGNFRGFNVRSDEITSDWKAATLRLPVAREFVSVDQLVTPWFKAFEDLIETGTISAKNIARSVAESFGAVFGGTLAPAVHTGIQAGQLVSGYNPYDFYRKRGILSNDVQEAGTYLQKFYEYMLWSLNNNAPSLFSYQPKAESTDATGPFEYLAGIPQAGPLLRGFVGISNYGDFEKSKELEQRKIEVDANIRLGMGENSKRLFNEYRKAQRLITRLGKGWQRDVSSDQRNKIHRLNNWHARYLKAFNEMRNAYELGDSEGLDMLYERLESSSTGRVDQILGE